MNTHATLGTKDLSIQYIDRPTVKVLIFNDRAKVLIINNGLLPGGGVEDGEEYLDALHRETMEELGINIADVKEVGVVVQYRDFLKKKYVINGYTARYLNSLGDTLPQDEGESQFTYGWHEIHDAMELLDESISRIENSPVRLDDSYQGKLFNLKTTRLLLSMFAKS